MTHVKKLAESQFLVCVLYVLEIFNFGAGTVGCFSKFDTLLIFGHC